MPHQHHAKHQHQHLGARAMHIQPRDQETVVQVIYKTAEKTFDGPIAGYKTLDGSEDSGNNAALAPQTQEAQPQPAPSPVEQSIQAVQAPVPVQPTSVAEAPTTPTHEVSTPAATPQEHDPTTPTPIVAPVSTTGKPNQKAATPASSSMEAESTRPAKKPSQGSNSVVSQVSSHITRATPTQDGSATSSYIAQNAAASSTSTPGVGASKQSDGMSGGAKAGLAIGILFAIGLLLGLIFFCYRRKKKQQREAYEVADDEKSVAHGAGGAAALNRAASTRTNATAPRLSLRPVTQFLPDLAGRRKSGNALAAAGGRRNLAPGDNTNEKTPVQNRSTNPTNPFGDNAEPSEKALAPRQERAMVPNQANNPTNPFGNHAETLDQPTNGDRSLPTDAPVPAPLRVRTPTPEGNPNAVIAGAAGAALAAAGVADQKHNAPKPLNLSPKRSASPAPMPSPSGTEFSMNSVTPAAMANGPPPSNVHRVQLDFKPSMEDELALRAGQLVRLLHEYDDGWALCIRLDRSQQGVAPRTCLSARPVKPRPNPNARGPAPRGPAPPGMFGPGQQRLMPPSSGRGSPSPDDRAPRGMAPGPHSGQRSMSPGPYGGGPQHPNIPSPGGKRRSNSASEVRERRMSPPRPSPMNPNAQGILAGVQKASLKQQAVGGQDQAPLSSSPPASIPARKPVPGQAM
ncbi:MAG: hypothetical protein Q9166_001497 [cf. Caloplaca sp. 2 TL-2023]